jgi:hypothetical protein
MFMSSLYLLDFTLATHMQMYIYDLNIVLYHTISYYIYLYICMPYIYIYYVIYTYYIYIVLFNKFIRVTNQRGIFR